MNKVLCLSSVFSAFKKSVLLSTILVVGACSTSPKSDFDTQYNFTNLRTFSHLDSANTGDPLSADRIKLSVINTLTAQGFTFQEANADFKVTYDFITQEKPKDSGFSIGLGSGSWGSGGGIGVGTSIGIPLGGSVEKTQTIQIDIIESASNRLIWRGSEQYTFDEGGEEKARKADETVKIILAQFPPK